MPGPTKQLSLDANFVFYLAAQKEFAHDFLEAFQKKGYALVLPPTAFLELHIILARSDNEAERELARTALNEGRTEATEQGLVSGHEGVAIGKFSPRIFQRPATRPRRGVNSHATFRLRFANRAGQEQLHYIF